MSLSTQTLRERKTLPIKRVSSLNCLALILILEPLDYKSCRKFQIQNNFYQP